MSKKPTPTAREPSAAGFKRLFEILRYRRPHESKAESECISRFVRSIKGHKEYEGGIVIEVLPKVPPGAMQWRSETMFSCHTDTVHWQGGMQNLVFDKELMILYKDDKQPLGADNGAGMWLLLEMIGMGIPGTYVFHRGEEKGGIGSDWFAEHMPEEAKRFKRAIAFDRRGTNSVITKQRGDYCCSSEFALALCGMLNDQNTDFDFSPDPTGTFTDTANYVHLIAECTNISIGYDHEHTDSETLDLLYLSKLREAVKRIDWESLPTARKPAKRQFGWFGGGHKHSSWEDDDTSLLDLMFMTQLQLDDWVYKNPIHASTMMFELLHDSDAQKAPSENVVLLAGRKYLDDGEGNIFPIVDRQERTKYNHRQAALLTSSESKDTDAELDEEKADSLKP